MLLECLHIYIYIYIYIYTINLSKALNKVIPKQPQSFFYYLYYLTVEKRVDELENQLGFLVHLSYYLPFFGLIRKGESMRCVFAYLLIRIVNGAENGPEKNTFLEEKTV